MKEDTTIQKMSSLLIFVSHDYEQYYPKCRLITSFGNGTVVYIWNKDEDKWDTWIKELYEALCREEKDVSFNDFSSYLITLIFSKKFNNFIDIVNYFKDKRIEEFHFLKPCYGLQLKDSDFVTRRGITLIKKDYFIDFYKNNEHLLEMNDFDTLKEQMLFIDIICKAKDSNKAEEYAIQKFKTIDICFRFLLKNNNSQFRIGIYDLNYKSNSDMLIYGKNVVAKRFEITSNTIEIDKYLDYIFNSTISNKTWYIMEKTDLNDMEKRIREAIIWIAEATHQNDISISFIQCFLALEAILMEQDGLINKSIAAQISEYVAFLLGKDASDRIMMEKEVKRLYAIRSAIAHGKSKTKINSDLDKIFDIVRKIIVKFLTNDNLISIHNVRELREHVTNLKYQ